MVRVGDSGLPTRTSPSSAGVPRYALFAAVVPDPEDEAPDFDSLEDEEPVFASDPDFASEPDFASDDPAEPESDEPGPDDESPEDDAPDSDEDDELEAVARLSLR
jgi:hypothetical protein